MKKVKELLKDPRFTEFKTLTSYHYCNSDQLGQMLSELIEVVEAELIKYSEIENNKG